MFGVGTAIVQPEVCRVLETLSVSRETRGRIEAYVAFLLSWQKRINLIGPTTIEKVWERHILDCLELLPLLPPGTRRIADLGSGAGLPGLVVAIAADLEVHLYESKGKKAAFLREAARLTRTKAHVHAVRLEAIRAEPDIPRVDCVVARALAPLPLLLEYAEPFLAQGAVGLFHKGQDVDAELTQATKYWNMNVTKHSSLYDSRGIILEIHEATRV